MTDPDAATEPVSAAEPARAEARRLELPPDAMRALGYRVVDQIVDHLAGLERARAGAPPPSRAELEARLREPAPEQGRALDETLERLRNDVLPYRLKVDHPRFFAYVPGPSNFVSAVADFMAAGYNVFAGSWQSSAGAAQIELITIDWIREALGLPASTGGLFVSGGSMANLTALAAARHARGADAHSVVYFSDQTHFATPRALRLLGFVPDALRELPSDASYRLDPSALTRAIGEDRAHGRTPFCVVANLGTTSTGAVDPLHELAEICRDEGLWLHGDGAYGAAAALSPAGRAALAGMAQVDSLAVDPHKWLFQPFEAGLVLLREPDHLRQAFAVTSAYTRDAERALEEVTYFNHGVQLTRSFRALKLWLSIQTFGMAAFREAVAHGVALAQHAERRLRAEPHWEVVTPASLGIVTFRHLPPAPASDDAVDAHNREVVQRLTEDGFAIISTTELHGRTVLRLCTINPRTTEEDIEATLGKIHVLAGEHDLRPGSEVS